MFLLIFRNRRHHSRHQQQRIPFTADEGNPAGKPARTNLFPQELFPSPRRAQIGQNPHLRELKLRQQQEQLDGERRPAKERANTPFRWQPGQGEPKAEHPWPAAGLQREGGEQ